MLNETGNAEEGETLLGTYIQVGFVDTKTMKSVTAEKVIAAEKSARLVIVPILYITTLSATNNNYIRWRVSIEALDTSVKIESVDVSLTYVDLSDMRPTWSVYLEQYLHSRSRVTGSGYYCFYGRPANKSQVENSEI